MCPQGWFNGVRAGTFPHRARSQETAEGVRVEIPKEHRAAL
jgi:hypothetical protein